LNSIGPRLQRLKKIFSATAAAVAVLTLALLVALWAKPPDLLRIGAAYAAKIVCSNVFLADRDPAEVLRDDVQAPGIWLLSLVRVSVDRPRSGRAPARRRLCRVAGRQVGRTQSL
jgi:hypothetical protein